MKRPRWRHDDEEVIIYMMKRVGLVLIPFVWLLIPCMVGRVSEIENPRSIFERVRLYVSVLTRIHNIYVILLNAIHLLDLSPIYLLPIPTILQESISSDLNPFLISYQYLNMTPP